MPAKAVRVKCQWLPCHKRAVPSAWEGRFCGKHTKELMQRRSVVRVAYKIKRIAKEAWGLGVTMTNRDIVSHTGGGEFRLLAAFDSNDELADWIKAHPAPKPYVGTLISAEKKARELTGYYHIELAEKVIWGYPSPRAEADIERYKEHYKLAALSGTQAVKGEG